MQLFKRVLLSLFPDDFQQQQLNPVSLFISFVSSKQFFSVINRKIVENYKLNLFDVSLDSFEVKIGFGEKPAITMQQLEDYYGYCSAANLNGYRFFNPGTVGISITMLVATMTHESFRKHTATHFRLFLVTTMYLHYVFASHIKSFPEGSRESQYNRFVDLFFNFYQLNLQQNKENVSLELFKKIKSTILLHPSALLLIFSSVKLVAEYINVPKDHLHSYFERFLFDIHNQEKTSPNVARRFLSHCHTSIYSKHFTSIEQKLLTFILPVDLLIKYIFQDEYIANVCEYILSKIFSHDELSLLVHNLVKDEKNILEILRFVTDSQLWKAEYLEGIKQFINHHRLEKNGTSTNQDLDELMSAIGINDQIDDVNMIPESIRKESAMMENFMNFYITHIGGLRIARGDNGYLRIVHRPLLKSLLSQVQPSTNQQEIISFFGKLLHLYNKNSFYYSHAYDNIKAGKDRFHLPFKATIQKVHTHSFLIPHFIEHYLGTLLQDLCPKDTRIYITQSSIIKKFKKDRGTQVKNLSELEQASLVRQVYRPLEKLLGIDDRLSQTIQAHCNKHDIIEIKDRLYNIDFWLYMQRCTILYSINQGPLQLPLELGLGITAMVKENLLGLLLLLAAFSAHSSKTAEDLIEKLLTLYTTQILHLTGNNIIVMKKSIHSLFVLFKPLLKLWLKIDDNKEFLRVAVGSRKKYLKQTKNRQHHAGEDLVRLYSYLKTVHYYNIRYVLPR